LSDEATTTTGIQAPRALVVTGSNTFPSDGRPTAGIFWANLLTRLRRLLGELVVVTPTAYIPGPLLAMSRFAVQRRILPHQWLDGVEVYRPPYLSYRAKKSLRLGAWLFYRSAARTCLRLHAGCPFDVVVGYEFGFSAYAARRIARRLGLPCVSWAIGSDVNTSPGRSAGSYALVKGNVEGTDVVLTESDALRQAILAKWPQARNIHTFYKGIDLRDTRLGVERRAELRAKFGLAEDAICMISAGTVLKAKGVVEFYEAFTRLSQVLPKLRAIWVGGGPEAEPLRQRVRRDGLADRFQITGHLARSAVLEYMQAADVMAFPSYIEGLPNVVMEALACGLPTVATAVGGTAEVLVHERTGLLVPAQDPAALADAVGRMLANRPWAQGLAVRGSRFVNDYFDVDKNAPVALEILQRVVRREPPQTPVRACAGVRPGHLPAEELQT